MRRSIAMIAALLCITFAHAGMASAQ